MVIMMGIKLQVRKLRFRDVKQLAWCPGGTNTGTSTWICLSSCHILNLLPCHFSTSGCVIQSKGSSPHHLRLNRSKLGLQLFPRLKYSNHQGHAIIYQSLMLVTFVGSSASSQSPYLNTEFYLFFGGFIRFSHFLPLILHPSIPPLTYSLLDCKVVYSDTSVSDTEQNYLGSKLTSVT
jgi:hypothetical protein